MCSVEEIGVICGELVHTQYQHIQHLRCCVVIETLQPPVPPAAIHIEEPHPASPRGGSPLRLPPRGSDWMGLLKTS